MRLFVNELMRHYHSPWDALRHINCDDLSWSWKLRLLVGMLICFKS